MGKITIIEHVSLEGIIEAPGGLEEEPGCPYGGWAAPHADPKGEPPSWRLTPQPFALLPGRRVYDT